MNSVKCSSPHPRSGSGFSLVEVLIVVALMGIVFMGMMSLFKGLNKGARNIRQTGSWVDAETSTRMLLSNPTLCTCNLAPAGAGARSFAPAAAATTIFNLANLSNYNAACTPPGSPVVQVTATPPTNTDAWINQIQLMNFFIIDPGNAMGVLRIRGQNTSVGSHSDNPTAAKATDFNLFKDFNVYFQTTTVGATVTLNACLGPQTIGQLIPQDCVTRYPPQVIAGGCGINASVSCNPGEYLLSGGGGFGSNMALQNSGALVNAQNLPVGWATTWLQTINNCDINTDTGATAGKPYCFVTPTGSYCGGAYALCCK